MNPHYTERDLRLMQEEFMNFDLDQSDDPIGSFIHRKVNQLKNNARSMFCFQFSLNEFVFLMLLIYSFVDLALN